MQCDSVGCDWPTGSRNPPLAWLNLKHRRQAGETRLPKSAGLGVMLCMRRIARARRLRLMGPIEDRLPFPRARWNESNLAPALRTLALLLRHHASFVPHARFRPM